VAVADAIVAVVETTKDAVAAPAVALAMAPVEVAEEVLQRQVAAARRASQVARRARPPLLPPPRLPARARAPSASASTPRSSCCASATSSPTSPSRWSKCLVSSSPTCRRCSRRSKVSTARRSRTPRSCSTSPARARSSRVLPTPGSHQSSDLSSRGYVLQSIAIVQSGLVWVELPSRQCCCCCITLLLIGIWHWHWHLVSVSTRPTTRTKLA